ncbi:MAG: DUF1565 domain-containing protein, partial [Planctomycetes bacterium]|nr:DUF1565 domain-containing protein [Planctomycetota bacterium]
CFINDMPVYTSPVIRKSAGHVSFPVPVQVDVNPGDRLKLAVDSLFDQSGDHSSWLQPAFVGEDIMDPIIEVSSSRIVIYAVECGENPSEQMLTVRNSGMAVLNWQIIENCQWLEAYPLGGASAGEPNQVQLTINTTGIAPGPHYGELLISDPGAINHGKIVSVVLHILAGQILIPDQLSTIQDGIDYVVPGGSVIVADGVYQGTGNRDLNPKGKTITIRSANGPASCIIDCQGGSSDNHRGFTIHSGEGQNTVIEGFTIINGYFHEGGGIYCRESNPTIRNCIISNNTAEAGGGGIYIKESSSAIVSECVIDGNHSLQWAGGILCTDSSTPTIVNCIVSNNSTGNYGGGIYCRVSSDALLLNNTFYGNTAATNGGAVRCYQSSPTVNNTILWNNTPEQIYIVSGTPVVTYCNVQGNWNGSGNIDSNPYFVDAVSGDFHLESQAGRWNPNSLEWVVDDGYSPGIDAGDPGGDGTGELWPHGMRVNMGAYGGTPEASMSLSVAGNIADLNHDGVVDFVDWNLFGAMWLKQQVLMKSDLDRDGVEDLRDIYLFVKNWLWKE